MTPAIKCLILLAIVALLFVTEMIPLAMTAKISPLKQASDFYAKPGKWPGSNPKQQLKSCLFRPSIKCTFTTMIHGRDLDNRTDITLI